MCGVGVAVKPTMRRAVPPLAIVLLLGREAGAQGITSQASRLASSQAEVAAQSTFDTSYLLAHYMTELAASGRVLSQADIDEASRQYFTNGAEATGVPTSGPRAAYFKNGAEATGVPTSGPGADYFKNGAEVMAYRSAPIAPPPETVAQPSRVPAAAVSAPEPDSGASEDAAGPAGAAGEGREPAGAVPVVQGPPPEAAPGASSAATAACPPSELQAAIAIANQFAGAAAPPTETVACAPTPAAESTQPVAPSRLAQPAPECQSRPSLWARVIPALGGAFLGGLAVALWSLPRAVRGGQRRQASPPDSTRRG